MRRRAVVSSALILLVLGVLTSCGEPPPPQTTVRPVQAMRVTGDSAQAGTKFPGQARAVQEIDLSFRVAGTLIELPVDIGDEVEAGHTVAQLDPRDFDVQIMDFEASLSLTRANLAVADDELQRVQRAFDAGAATDFELTSKREAKNAITAQVASAQAKLEAAKDSLGYATLQAPFAGDIATLYVDNFQDVRGGEPVMRILDDSRIEMVVYVPEHLMTGAPTATDLRCEFDAFPGVILTADLKEIGTEADPVTRTYPVTLIMDQPDGVQILPGMTGNAWSVQSPPDSGGDAGFTIPLSALGEDADGIRFVWVVDEQPSTVSRRDVEVGEMVLGGVRVQGIQEGEIIATAGAAFLSAGQLIKPVLTTSAGDGV